MRDLLLRLTPFALCCLLTGCAAFDGVAPRGIELSDLPAPDGAGARGAESLDMGSRSKHDEPSGGRDAAAPRPSLQEPVAMRRPRPDGPNMDIYKSSSCYAALRSVAGDGAIPPHTRALAGEVLKCDSESGHYDLRHAPCPLFPAADDDRGVDLAIQELRAVAPVCSGPPA